jgi:hypothetical protein
MTAWSCFVPAARELTLISTSFPARMVCSDD